MIHFLIELPTWMLIRTFGILSYLTLFMGMAVGITYSYPQIKGHKKGQLLRWHTYANVTGMCFALLHTVLLIIDTFMPFDWAELLIPFSAKNNPVLNGLGTIAMYGLLLVLFTTDIRHKLKRKLWLALHMLSYPIFALSLLHGIFLGTDSKQGWAATMYIATAIILVGLTLVRFQLLSRKRQVKVRQTKQM
ncbi:ferric reductase-like transmembrane domain-containing protein [Paenibacillus qinlingensis]|uniref:ferric reductase-like transmembrane domain-containing protein n=1 Tax=Paenibacillus qinlingensis TaxID=1837343 RepID=UPI001FE6326E|nr:ferric reductase-like transmembrane domain-containing protein [Paenibacillus qinlingensis]